MTRREELDLFLIRAEELISTKYILADVKIINLLKAIASSDALLAIFKNCLSGFNYQEAQKKYFVRSKYISDNKGEFILPPNSRELLAFVFNILMDLDARRLNLGEFINKYFYVDGSFSAAFDAFINGMIKPFVSAVKLLMESVIEGKVQDPIEALTEEENRVAREKAEEEEMLKRREELSKKAYYESIKKIQDLILKDKEKIKNSKKDDSVKEELIYIADMLANVIEGDDKDAVNYAFLAYKYMALANRFTFRGRVKKISALLKDILNEL